MYVCVCILSNVVSIYCSTNSPTYLSLSLSLSLSVPFHLTLPHIPFLLRPAGGRGRGRGRCPIHAYVSITSSASTTPSLPAYLYTYIIWGLGVKFHSCKPHAPWDERLLVTLTPCCQYPNDGASPPSFLSLLQSLVSSHQEPPPSIKFLFLSNVIVILVHVHVVVIHGSMYVVFATYSLSHEKIIGITLPNIPGLASHFHDVICKIVNVFLGLSLLLTKVFAQPFVLRACQRTIGSPSIKLRSWNII